MTDQPHQIDPPTVFALVRDTDITGVSGTGLVAYGLSLPDGRAVVCWLGDHPSSVVWPGPDGTAHVQTIHGHNGATRIVRMRVDPADDYAAYAIGFRHGLQEGRRRGEPR